MHGSDRCGKILRRGRVSLSLSILEAESGPKKQVTDTLNTDSNILMVACSEKDANIYYASHFLAPDPFIYIQANGTSSLLMSDLEIDRARLQSTVDRVLPYSEYEVRAKASGVNTPGLCDVLHICMKEQQVEEWIVPDNFPLRYGDALRGHGHRLLTKPEPFFEQRALKMREEVTAILQTQIAIEEALDHAIDLLRNAEIRENLLYVNGVPLTSEAVRKQLHMSLMEKGYIGEHTIVSCGVDACDPHQEGSGPLRAHESIIFDIFPRSIETRYYADMSRTVVKGSAPDPLKRLYDTVLEGQLLGIQQIKSGVSGKDIHMKIVECFESKGYKTGVVDGRMQGFFHGTGHGVGLEIHEPPRISRRDQCLREGEVVTVEPGLYYPDIGAVRIEDMVLVEENGCKNLTSYPKFLEIT